MSLLLSYVEFGIKCPLAGMSNGAPGNRHCLRFLLRRPAGLRLHLGITTRGLLDVGREVREFLHLPDFDDFIVRGWTALAHSMTSSFDFT